jgi:DinB superfamily
MELSIARLFLFNNFFIKFMKEQDKRRYPIGKFEYGKTYTPGDIKKLMRTIEALPKTLKKIVKRASKIQIDTPYRPGGWTVRQVIHHLADSHMNAYIRMKMAVTEHKPTIKPYAESEWAETADSKKLSPKVSIRLLKSLHERWFAFLASLSAEDLQKGYIHPATNRFVPIYEAIALYAWHCEHHLAHIKLVTDAVSLEKVPSTQPAEPKAKRGRPAKAKKAADAPKMSREEVLAKARAARAAKSADKPAKAKKAADAPKMSREEVLAKARAARAAKSADKPAKGKKK